jgi:hypothetical protein
MRRRIVHGAKSAARQEESGELSAASVHIASTVSIGAPFAAADRKVFNDSRLSTDRCK